MKRIDRVLRSHLKFRHLRMLVAIDEMRNLGRAAEFLGMSQPAASKTLREIERAFGVTLFERSARGTFPTVFGQSVIRFARTVMVEFERARGELAALAHGGAELIKVGAMSLAVPILMARSLSCMKTQSPHTTVLVEEGFLDTLLPKLRIGEFDFVLGRLEPRWATPDLHTERLYGEALAVVASVDHPLSRQDTVAWAQLAAEPWIVPRSGAPSRMILDQIFLNHGLDIPTDTIETTSFLAMLAILRERKCVGLLSSSLANHFAHLGDLTILPVTVTHALAPVGLFALRDRPRSPVVDELISCLHRVGDEIEKLRC